MESRAKLFGHSIHAMLIAFPVGLFVTAVVFDIIHLVSNQALWALISYWMIVAGIIGGLTAALFGLLDYLKIAAVALASITAWLGGELVERLGVGVDDGAHLNAPSSLSGPVKGP